MTESTAAFIVGCLGVVALIASCILLSWSRRNLEQATEAWREAGRIYEEISDDDTTSGTPVTDSSGPTSGTST